MNKHHILAVQLCCIGLVGCGTKSKTPEQNAFNAFAETLTIGAPMDDVKRLVGSLNVENPTFAAFVKDIQYAIPRSDTSKIDAIILTGRMAAY